MTEHQNVSTPSLAYGQMKKSWDLPVALCGGTRAMRAAGKKYLPQEKKESEDNYNNRLKRTILFNGFKRTKDVLGGLPFSKPVTLKDGTSPMFEEMKSDVDLGGQDLTAFAQRALDHMLTFGKAHILVDFPISDETPQQGLPVIRPRAYFNLTSPLDLIAWRSRRINGVETLTEIRKKETVIEPKERWGEEEFEQIRVLMRDSFQVWRKVKDDWILKEQGKISIGKIPLVTIYANQTGFLTADPTLEDLAWLNLRHWQSQSDQDNILHVARVPILFGAGFKKGDLQGAEIGASKAISTDNPNSRLEYVEHTGAAISAGAEDLTKIEERMQALGAELLVAKPSNATATGRAIDAVESISDLQAMVRNLETGLESAFQFAAEWLGVTDSNAIVDINQDFGMWIRDSQQAKTLLEAAMANKIDDRTFVTEWKRRGMLSDSTDVDEVLSSIQTQPATGSGGIVPFPIEDAS